MARFRRSYYRKAVYHIYNRGNNRQDVFKSDEDKMAFLSVLAKYKERFCFKIYGFVLIDNHYHMVIETDSVNHISKIMQAVQLAYGSQFRKKYKYLGHLWQSRFQSRIIESERYILECLDYIHN